MASKQGRTLTQFEIETHIRYQETLKDCLTPQQASDFLDDCHANICNQYGGLYNLLPEYPPRWLSGLINCVQATPVPSFGGSNHYFEKDLLAFFYDCYSPSVLADSED